jgi:hypothetical protein
MPKPRVAKNLRPGRKGKAKGPGKGLTRASTRVTNPVAKKAIGAAGYAIGAAAAPFLVAGAVANKVLDNSKPTASFQRGAPPKKPKAQDTSKANTIGTAMRVGSERNMNMPGLKPPKPKTKVRRPRGAF